MKKICGLNLQQLRQNRTVASLTARQLAFEICVQRIAKAISKCEFRTYEKKEKKNSFIIY